MLALLWLTVLSLDAAFAREATPEKGKADSTTSVALPDLTLESFLDRLMLAESGGNDVARNKRSSALGSFQFIKSTFLEVARRHFGEETAELAPSAILALRTDRSFARRAAEAYTKDNAAHLVSEGLNATFPHLRLAFLVGPTGAVRVLRAHPDTKVATVLSSYALNANPFMVGMTVAELVTKCARDLSVAPGSMAGVIPQKGAARAKPRPLIKVKCNLQRPSCRRWLALAKARLKRKQAGKPQIRDAGLRQTSIAPN